MIHNTPHPRFTVASSETDAVWTFTTGMSSPDEARRYYAETLRVPLESVSVGYRADHLDPFNERHYSGAPDIWSN